MSMIFQTFLCHLVLIKFESLDLWDMSLRSRRTPHCCSLLSSGQLSIINLKPFTISDLKINWLPIYKHVLFWSTAELTTRILRRIESMLRITRCLDKSRSKGKYFYEIHRLLNVEPTSLAINFTQATFFEWALERILTRKIASPWKLRNSRPSWANILFSSFWVQLKVLSNMQCQ